MFPVIGNGLQLIYLALRPLSNCRAFEAVFCSKTVDLMLDEWVILMKVYKIRQFTKKFFIKAVKWKFLMLLK